MMKWKVCGMKFRNNIEDVLALSPDYMGFIFYPPSSRYVNDELDPLWLSHLTSVNKVGVFVNAEMSEVINRVANFQLDTVQLHGTEPPEYCRSLSKIGVEVIKAFTIGTEGIKEKTWKSYEEFCTYFLFDTKGKLPGGNGEVFNWEVLDQYTGNTPFFLSGGISLDNVQTALSLSHPLLYGIDVNSRFELYPAIKNIDLIKKLKEIL